MSSGAPASSKPPPASQHAHASGPAPTAHGHDGSAVTGRDGSVRNGAAGRRPPLGRNLLFELDGIDLSGRVLSRQDLERWNPHRGDMALLDGIVWHAEDFTRAIAVKHVRSDEFWVPGHFPGRPLMPGVLQVEAGAQLAVYLYNVRLPKPIVAAFTRLERCSFRHQVEPGDDLFVLCKETKWSRRGFTCDVQGMVNGHVTFDAEVQGIAI